MPRLGVSSKKAKHVFHREFTSGALAFDGEIGQFSLAVLEIDDTLLHCSFDDHLVNLDIPCLVKAVHSVDGLLFDKLGTVSTCYCNPGFDLRDSKKVPG